MTSGVKEREWRVKPPVPRRLRLNFYNLFWIFVIVSIIGLALETLYWFIAFGYWQARYGLIWGPFSPIYGVGACILTIMLYRVWDTNAAIIFLVSACVGTAFEWVASYFMELFFKANCWDYSNTVGSIGGRTNIIFGIAWGVLGLLWVKLLFPLIVCLIDRIPFNYHIVFTVAMCVFMTLDIAVTFCAWNREYQRVQGIPAKTEVSVLCDEYYPDDVLHARFQNMVLEGQDYSYRVGNARQTSHGMDSATTTQELDYGNASHLAICDSPSPVTIALSTYSGLDRALPSAHDPCLVT